MPGRPCGAARRRMDPQPKEADPGVEKSCMLMNYLSTCIQLCYSSQSLKIHNQEVTLTHTHTHFSFFLHARLESSLCLFATERVPSISRKWGRPAGVEACSSSHRFSHVWRVKLDLHFPAQYFFIPLYCLRCLPATT